MRPFWTPARINLLAVLIAILMPVSVVLADPDCYPYINDCYNDKCCGYETASYVRYCKYVCASKPGTPTLPGDTGCCLFSHRSVLFYTDYNSECTALPGGGHPCPCSGQYGEEIINVSHYAGYYCYKTSTQTCVTTCSEQVSSTVSQDLSCVATNPNLGGDS
jgi:hypothetical protein